MQGQKANEQKFADRAMLHMLYRVVNNLVPDYFS